MLLLHVDLRIEELGDRAQVGVADEILLELLDNRGILVLVRVDVDAVVNIYAHVVIIAVAVDLDEHAWVPIGDTEPIRYHVVAQLLVPIATGGLATIERLGHLPHDTPSLIIVLTSGRSRPYVHLVLIVGIDVRLREIAGLHVGLQRGAQSN